jgi:hypothetical protein
MAKKKNKPTSPVEGKIPTEEAPLEDKVVAKSVPESTTKDTLVKQDVLPEGFTTTTKVASVVNDPVGISGVNGPFSVGSYGGKALSGAGSASSLPSQGGPVRSDSRERKKLDSTVKKVNSIVSEQVQVAYKESKPINESTDSQGYSGRYTDAHLRTSKINGSHPGDLLFDRSVDEITRDELNFIEGQYIRPNGCLVDHVTRYVKGASTDLGAIKLTNDNLPKYRSGISGDKSIDLDGTVIAKDDYVRPIFTKGNYVIKDFIIHVSASGDISLSVVEDDITPPSNIDFVDRASHSALTKANQLELDRQMMESKAGNENADNWTPLALAVEEPTAINAMLKTIEADVGSSIFAAISKAEIAHSYQLNKAFKDGQRFDTIGEMLTDGHSFMASHDAPSRDEVFSDAAYRNGNASLIISIYDSINKYNNRADVLTQPRSLKMHLATARHYAKQMKVDENFAKHFKHSEAFSFLGDSYDPFLPICITDAETEVHSLRFSDFIDANGKPRAFKYTYGNIRNNMTQLVFHPLIAGIYDWAVTYAGKLRRFDKDTNEGISTTYTFKVLHGTKFISGWDILLCAATPHIAKRRIQSMHDVIDYETKNGYPYSGLIDVSVALEMPYKNFSFVSIEEPLNVGKMNPAVAVTWRFPELLYYMGKWDATSLGAERYYYMAPWYMSSKSFDLRGVNGGKLTKNISLSYTPSMSMPSIRSGSVLSSLDALYDVSERDLRLAYDMMITMPNHEGIGAGSVFLHYKYGRTADGIPIIGYQNLLTYGDVLKTPRELGFNLVVPANYLRANSGAAVEVDDDDDPALPTLATNWFGDTSYCAYVWRANADGATGTLPDIISINERGAALQQVWHNYPATVKGVAENADSGVYLGLNNILDANGLVLGAAAMYPFTDLDDSGLTDSELKNLKSEGFKFYSFAPMVWYVIQRLPMMLSPWDCALKQSTEQNSIIGMVDPFELLYWFGLAGFRASDFAEDITNRVKKRSVEGITYVTDLLVADCPVLR